MTPFFDGWSVDAWVVAARGRALIPSRCPDIDQRMLYSGNLIVRTRSRNREGMSLSNDAQVKVVDGQTACVLELEASSEQEAWLAVSFRPCNPEGVSFIHELSLDENGRRWLVNGKYMSLFAGPPDRYCLSEYAEGDVFYRLFEPAEKKEIACPVGMATGAALFQIPAGGVRKTILNIPLAEKRKAASTTGAPVIDVAAYWDQVTAEGCKLDGADRDTEFLYDAAVRTLVLHTAEEVYAGPYTYRRFWVRDASLILQALVCLNLVDRAEGFVEALLSRQNASGLSREGSASLARTGRVDTVVGLSRRDLETAGQAGGLQSGFTVTMRSFPLRFTNPSLSMRLSRGMTYLRESWVRFLVSAMVRMSPASRSARQVLTSPR